MGRLSLRLSLVPEPTLQEKLEARLRETIVQWENKLKQPLPLAPSALKGKITHSAYEKENSEFGNFVSDYVAQELELMDGDSRPGDIRAIYHFGIGEGADLGYFPIAIRQGFCPIAFDISETARDNGRGLLKTMIRSRKMPTPAVKAVKFGDVESVLRKAVQEKADNLCAYPVRLVQICRLLQFLDPPKLDRTLYELGKLLANGEVKAVVVHPFPENNRDVQWGQSHSYLLEDIMIPLAVGANRSVMVSRSSTHAYFHQVYTACTIEAMP